MSDIFSYPNNTKTSGQIASSDFAFISIGGGGSAKNSLVQNVDVSYQQQIEEVTQVGSTEIYWMAGRPQGRVSVNRIVGAGGFFQGWQQPCGVIETATVSVQGGRCGFNGTGSLTMEGCVIESLNLQLATGRQTIAEGAQIRVASISSGGGGGGVGDVGQPSRASIFAGS